MPTDPDQLRDEPEFEVVKTADDVESEQRRNNAGGWLVALVILAVAAVAAYLLVGRRAPSEPASAGGDSVLPATASEAAPPLVSAAPVDLPPLDETDTLVRSMLSALSSHPSVATWLATNGLIRNFTVVVANVAEGKTPSRHLRPLRPTAPFRVVTRGKRFVLDPRSYARYDGLAAAVASIDPAGAARLYTNLKPRIDDAYRDLGNPDVPFDATLERAIVQLLETPVVEGTVYLEPAGGTGYGFTDPALEELTDAQKQLLRTGPENVRTIQTALRATALALGIPAARLPVPRYLRMPD